MLIACTTSTDTRLCDTADALEIIFGATSTAGLTNADVDKASRLVTRASAWAETYIGRGVLTMQTYSETLPGSGGRTLMVSVRPIVKVLRFFDSTSTASAHEFLSSEFRVENGEAGLLSGDAGFSWTAAVVGASDFSLGLTTARRPGQLDRPYLVEYIAGWSVTGTTSTATGRSTSDDTWSTGPTLPDDVRMAVALRAAEMFSNPLGVTSRQVGDLSVSYGNRSGGKRESEALLSQYRSAI